ncbi:hypothetical protein BHE74_00054333 [Ensete ventricosum]|nr:hypothetical protein GW17_00004851 [Ensete ventricosum]RWW40269.1 hypothetical protein BHE74_00054333 [Ensete ventricosum]
MWHLHRCCRCGRYPCWWLPLLAVAPTSGRLLVGYCPCGQNAPCGLVVGDCPHQPQLGRPLQGALVIAGRLCRGLIAVGRPCKWPGSGWRPLQADNMQVVTP